MVFGKSVTTAKREGRGAAGVSLWEIQVELHFGNKESSEFMRSSGNRGV